jgi:indole-3-glycerol phosphate synthase
MMPRVLEPIVREAERRARDLPAFAPRPSEGRRERFLAAFADASRMHVIAEFKAQSPSLGVINAEVSPESQARAYEAAGATAISVLTEPTRFGGSFENLERVARAVRTPALMKDFVVDERHLAEGARRGASAALLIVRCLGDDRLRALADAARAVDLAVLVECHTEEEIARALAIEGALVGVNNRDLDTLVIDLATSARLLPLVPPDRVAVAESGYEGPLDLAPVAPYARAALIGTALMRAPDPAALVASIAALRRSSPARTPTESSP